MHDYDYDAGSSAYIKLLLNHGLHAIDVHPTHLRTGVVVIKNQNLTRAEQVKFTGLLGEPVALAKSFYGKDPEPDQPSILRVTNFWANGTWKGTSHKFGDYWHQDGQFWDAPKHNMLSIVHACAEIKFTARSS